MHQMEVINRRAWRNPLYLRDYRRAEGYLNDGERILVRALEIRHPAGRMLDIGCGAGRIANLVKHFVGDYLGIDYTSEMVTAARDKHPDLSFEQLDARDLSSLADESFDLAIFSYNGIDSVDQNGRLAVLHEVNRVLKSGGSFAFSSFNRNWSGFDLPARPYGLRWAINPLRMALRLTRWTIGKLRERRYMPFEQRGEHTILLHSAHDFGIMVYATTPFQIRQQLADAGFTSEIQIMREDGQPLHDEDDAGIEYFYILACKAYIS